MTRAEPGPSGPSPSHSHRHRGYLQLLAVCLLVLVAFTLPFPWNRLSSPGYLLMGLVMIRVLGDPGGELCLGPQPRRLFRALGVAALAVSMAWKLLPLEQRGSAVPVILLWGLFSLWSAIRLVRLLALERVVNGPVLRGALAGYLMLGLAGGLLCAALESLAPESFSQGGLTAAAEGNDVPVWHLNFIRLHYFAFVALTTTGFGDVAPQTPQAQMLSVAIAIAGTFYLAAVMGLLIGRISRQNG